MSAPETLDVKQACTAHEAIQALIKDDRENKLVFPSSVRIKLAAQLRKTKPVYQEFSEEKIRLFKLYGEPVLDKDGKDTGSMKLKPENTERVDEELKAALAVDTGIVLTPITTEDLAGVSEAHLKVYPDAKQNQVDIELVAVLMDSGLLKE